MLIENCPMSLLLNNLKGGGGLKTGGGGLGDTPLGTPPPRPDPMFNPYTLGYG